MPTRWSAVKTKGAFPAAKADVVSDLYEGALVPFDTALKIEARWFTNILMNPSSSAMIRSLFLNKEALEKGAVRPKDVPDQRVKKLGVLGAGMMGAGIALVSAQAGIEVVLIDREQEAADKGKAYSATYMDKGIARKKATPEKKEALLSLITATPDVEMLKGCDLIIEAVFEDPAVKAEITKRVEAVIPEDCIFASNTSTLPISELAKASSRPEQFIGIHFFSPVEKMLLVEIIKGAQTGDARCGQIPRLRAPNPQNANRCERCAVLLRQPLHHPIRERSGAHGDRRCCTTVDRQRCTTAWSSQWDQSSWATRPRSIWVCAS